MKKYITLCLAIIIGAIVLSLITDNLGMRNSDVKVNEKILSGNVKEASGLVIERNFKLNGYINKSCTIKYVGSSYGFEDRGWFDYQKDDGEPIDEFHGIEFDCESFVDGEENYAKWEDKAKSDGKVVLYTSEYQDGYDLELMLYDSGKGEFVTGDDMVCAKKVREAFDIPIGKNVKTTIKYDKKQDDIDISSSMVAQFELKDMEVDGGHYLCINESGEDHWPRTGGYIWADVRDILAESNIQGGYGLYRYTLDGDDFKMENLFTPDNDGIIVDVYPTGHENEILVTSNEGSRNMYAYIVDTEKKKALGKFNLGRSSRFDVYKGKDYDTRQTCGALSKIDDEGYVWLFTNSKLLILERKNGHYEKCLEYDHDNELGMYLSDMMAVAYDGDKAAMAAIPGDAIWAGGDYKTSYGFVLAVIDNDGLKYHGAYDLKAEKHLKKNSYWPEEWYLFDGCINMKWGNKS